MNRLVNFKTGPGVDPNNYEVVGDLADKWEVSDGGLTYTFKLKQGVKFHNTAPVNGRVLDAEDVTNSYKRFSVGLTTGVGATTVGKAGSPSFGNSFSGVVESVTSPDKDTVVWKLTKPNAAFLNILGSYNFFWVYPKEVDVSYDPLQTVIGTGPWIISNQVRSSRIEYKKNPDYFEKGIPYMDGAVTYIIPEGAQRQAQFSAGSIFLYTPTIFDEFRSLTSEHPNLRIMGSGILGSVTGIGFGSDDPNGPFIKDVRLRHAASLAIDRQTIMEEFNDVDRYRSVGLEREYRHGMHIPPNLSKYWIDPRGSEMKDAAQWAQYDPAKAKQLMSAAGYADGFEFAQRYASRNTGPGLEVHPILQAQWAAIGMKSTITPEDYDSVFNPHSWHGDCTGVAIHNWQTFGDPAQQLDYLFGPTSTRNQMQINDPKFNDFQDKNLAELDVTKRAAIIKEQQIYLQNEMRHIGFGWGSINTFTLHQPQVRNNWAYRTSDSATGAVGTNTKHWWLDA
jgi:peptide/nickel transport system substrate-binding protein